MARRVFLRMIPVYFLELIIMGYALPMKVMVCAPLIRTT
jgi:hypothetical protein